MALDLSQLEALSAEEIAAVVARAKQVQKDRKSGSDREKEEKAKAELQPYEDKVAEAEDKYKIFDEKLKEEEKSLKQQIKERREAALAKVQEVREQRDAKRKELGLKVSRKASSGPQMSWNVDYNLEDKENPKATVSVQDKPEQTVTVDIDPVKGTVSSKVIKADLFQKFDIPDPTGGKWRGLVNRIKNGYLSQINENNEGPKEQASAPAPAEEANA